MARRARVIIPKAFYHILNRGNNKEIIFFDQEDFRVFLHLVKKYKRKFKIEIYHYCLMPNHFHFLLKPQTSQDLAGFMQGVQLVYAQHLQSKYDRVGHIWQGRYRSSIIEKEDYLGQCGYYIEDNPRRAGLAEVLEDWSWSSYHFYALGKPDPVVDVDTDYLKLGSTSSERQERYRKYIMGVREEKSLKSTRQKLAQGILGSDKFVEEMVEKFKIRLVRPGKSGRPPSK